MRRYAFVPPACKNPSDGLKTKILVEKYGIGEQNIGHIS